MKIKPIVIMLVTVLFSIAITGCQNSNAKKDTSVEYKNARSIPVLKIPAK